MICWSVRESAPETAPPSTPTASMLISLASSGASAAISSLYGASTKAGVATLLPQPDRRPMPVTATTPAAPSETSDLFTPFRRHERWERFPVSSRFGQG